MSDFMDEEFYDSYDSVYEEVDKFKRSLLVKVKNEFVEKMSRLEEENAEYRTLNCEQSEEVYRLKATVAGLRGENERLTQDAKRATLSELFKDIVVPAWAVGWEFISKPKCPYCDDNHQMTFTAPTGQTVKATCECAYRITVRTPKEMDSVNLHLSSFCPEGNEERFRSVVYCHEEDVTMTIKKIVKEIPKSWESISEYETIFLTKELCQEFCDYLNEKKMSKNDC